MDSKLFGFPSPTSRKFLRLAVDTSQTSVLLGLAQQPVVTERPTFGQTRKPSGVESHERISGATVKPGKDISSTKTPSFASSKRTTSHMLIYMGLYDLCHLFLEPQNCMDVCCRFRGWGSYFFLKSKPSNDQPLLFLDIPWSALQLCVEVT